MNSVEIAIRMETDAIRFYTEASARIKNAVGRKMFLSIAADEKRHLELLSQLLHGLDLTAADASPMQGLRTVFEEMKGAMMERAEAEADDIDAFRIAMLMESEGKEFYRKAALSAPTEKEKKLFERLVFEEEQHYAVFSNTYHFMKDTGNWFMWEEHSIVDGGTPWA